MGIAVRAAIIVGTAAAVYGVAKLRDASNQAASAVNGVNAAGSKFDAFAQKIKNAAGAMGGLSGALNIRSKISGAAKDIRDKLEASKAARLARSGVGPAPTPLWERIFGKAPAGSMTLTQNNIKLAIRGTNTLTRVAQEARGWYKLLFAETNKSGGTGLRIIHKTTRAITQSAREAQNSYAGLTSMLGGLVAAIGGTAILGGAGGVFERSFGLARAKEDARITFDTLLGSREVTDELLKGITKYSAETPFQKADIMGASKRLLTLSGKDVKENERLYKLSAQIAALKPGTSVEEVSQGIISGAFGEFEILKGLTFRMNAEMFKGAGKSGGKDYGQAVVSELEKQLKEKTGGRDLVLALSGSLTGLMSTIKDSVEEPLTAIGESMVEGIGIKQLMKDYIVQATYFSDYFAQLMSGKTAVADPAMASGVKVIADFITETVKKLVNFGKVAINLGKQMWKMFEALGPSMQRSIISVGIVGSTAVTAAALILPLISGIISLGSVMWAPLTAIGGALGAIGLKAGLIAGAILSIGAAVVGTGLFAAFMLFRRENEALGDTMKRLGSYVTGFLYGAFTALKTVLMSAWTQVSAALIPAWTRLESIFARVRPYLVELATLFMGTSTSGSTFADIGIRIGDALVWVMEAAITLVEVGMKAIQATMIVLRPHFKHMVSDLKLVVKTLFDFMSGSASMVTTMKTIFLGFIDVVTFPFRVIIEALFTLTAEALASAERMVRPVSSLIADGLEAASLAAKSAAESVSSGFLATRDELLGRDSSMSVNVVGDIVTSQVPIQLNMDGERVAEGQAQVGMRARHSGRGGNPMNPEEMGFVINDGRIRTVDMAAVASGG